MHEKHAYYSIVVLTIALSTTNCVTLLNSLQGASLSSKLILGIIEDFATEERAIEIADFFKTNQIPGTERAVALGIESIRVNEAWIRREKNISGLREYLDADAL